MSDFEKIIERIRSFEEEVNLFLVRYDSSPSRANKLTRTISTLDGLTLKQEKLFKEALGCITFIDLKLFRAAHVIAWAAMADYLEQWLGQDDFVTLSVRKGKIAEKKERKNISKNPRMLPEEKRIRISEAKQRAEEFWKFNSIIELRDTVTEHAIILSLHDCGYISKDERKALEGHLSTRNQCAHPSEYEPNYDETLGFISALLNRIKHYEKKRK
jgi:hypothetical protein